jgi:hypothetical protein
VYGSSDASDGVYGQFLYRLADKARAYDEATWRSGRTSRIEETPADLAATA